MVSSYRGVVRVVIFHDKSAEPDRDNLIGTQIAQDCVILNRQACFSRLNFPVRPGSSGGLFDSHSMGHLVVGGVGVSYV